MAACEVAIEEIGLNPDCPAGGDKVLFTRPDGLSEMREWATIKACLNNGLVSRADIRFQIGDGGSLTPPPGAVEYSNPDLVGKRFRVFRRGVGYLSEGVEFSILATGGFRLLLPGDVFSESEVFHVQEYETIVQAGDGALYRGIIPLSADTELQATDANFLFDLRGGNNRLRILLPAHAVVPVGSHWTFLTNHYCKFQPVIEASGPTISFRSQLRQRLFMGQNEYVSLVAGEDGWHVWPSSTGYEVVGRPCFDYIIRPNTAIAEGQIGLREDYPRIAEFLQENATVAVSETVWQSTPVLQRQLFSLGDGITTFRFPDLRGLHFRTLDRGRGLDTDTPAGSLPGRYQADEIKKHTHQSEEFSDRGWPRQSADRTNSYYFINRNQDNVLRRLELSEVGGEESRGKNVAFYGLINF
ncbi:hypothetical protein [Chitinophaga rhizosphaerae]|uniref:hypothetical protein n=1 Tax=Chitinophaga rhizosphaerae TaxID=1864947 RepID=UPI000F8004DF|nr:hypothetical protein [Chitinophaga rhizosphaerae]